MSSRLHKTIASVALGALCASLLISPHAMAGNGRGADIFPPKAHPYGQSMAEWLADHTRWKAAGFPGDGQCGKVLFLSPLTDDQPAGSGTMADPLIFTAHGDITIKAGTPVLDVLIAWYAEFYPDGTVDPLMPDEFWGTYVTGEITLNGRTILDEVEDYYVSPLNFRLPLLYPEPTPWGSIGTAFVQGVPIMLKPLPVGVHTYETVAYVLIPDGNGVTPETAVIFRTSRTITVVP